jgi:hypothetical protein
MAQSQVAGIVFSVIGILVSGGFGGLAGWLLVSLAGWTGTPGAIVAIVVGMVVATAIWVGLTSAVRSLRRPR